MKIALSKAQLTALHSEMSKAIDRQIREGLSLKTAESNTIAIMSEWAESPYLKTMGFKYAFPALITALA